MNKQNRCRSTNRTNSTKFRIVDAIAKMIANKQTANYFEMYSTLWNIYKLFEIHWNDMTDNRKFRDKAIIDDEIRNQF